jgi:hypothetical protein
VVGMGQAKKSSGGTMFQELLKQPVMIRTFTHDGEYLLITGTLEYYHPPSKQFYVRNCTIFKCKSREHIKEPVYSAEILLINERSVFIILKNHKNLAGGK